MQYIVYPDIMFATTACSVSFSFLFASVITDKHVRFRRILFYSFIISLFATLEFIFLYRIKKWLFSTLYVLFYIVMLKKCFKCSNIVQFLSLIFGSILYSLMNYGLICSILYRDGLVLIRCRDYILMLIFFLCMMILTEFLQIYQKQITLRKKNEYKILLRYQSKKIELIGFFDTGNQLFDYYSKSPVVIMDYHASKYIFEPRTYAIIEEYAKNGLFSFEKIGELKEECFYPILYQTIDGKNNILPVFKADELKFLQENKSFYNVSIGISRTKLMHLSNHTDKYTILLNEGLMPYKEENSND